MFSSARGGPTQSTKIGIFPSSFVKTGDDVDQLERDPEVVLAAIHYVLQSWSDFAKVCADGRTPDVFQTVTGYIK